MKKNVVLISIIIGLVCWQCTKTDQSGRNSSVKGAIEEGVIKINTALNKISESNGYQLLSANDQETKSDEGFSFQDSINLDLIAGIYDYNRVPELSHNSFFPYMLFTKTGTSDNLVVNLPEKMVFHPRHLHYCYLADSVLPNNFHITANDYHYYYNLWNNYDYKLSAGFALDKEDIGEVNIVSKWNSWTDNKYNRVFTFPEGYSIIKTGQTGDTTKTIFALTEQTDTLLSETYISTGDGDKERERQYILSIGNVDVKRSSGIDSIQVFLDGVLQKSAGAKIIDTVENDSDHNHSICHKRDILLTFDDGTTAKVSELISPSLATLKSLSQSLGEMYFSKHIIDYIAFSIYYNNH